MPQNLCGTTHFGIQASAHRDDRVKPYLHQRFDDFTIYLSLENIDYATSTV